MEGEFDYRGNVRVYETSTWRWGRDVEQPFRIWARWPGGPFTLLTNVTLDGFRRFLHSEGYMEVWEGGSNNCATIQDSSTERIPVLA